VVYETGETEDLDVDELIRDGIMSLGWMPAPSPARPDSAGQLSIAGEDEYWFLPYEWLCVQLEICESLQLRQPWQSLQACISRSCQDSFSALQPLCQWCRCL
jgi:hypothetical protein